MNESTSNVNRESGLSTNGPLSLRDRVQSLRLPDRAPPRRSVFSFVPWILCLILAGTCVAMAMRQQEQTAADLDAKKLAEEKSEAQAKAPGLAPGEAMLTSQGYIIPLHQIQVSPKVGGTVVSLRIEEGMMVEKGSILAVIEKIEYQAERDRARGMADAAWRRWQELINGSRPEEIQQALANLLDMTAQYDQELAKYKSAQQMPDKTVSREDREIYKARVDSYQAKIANAKEQFRLMVIGPRWERIAAAWAEVEQLEADFAKADWRLSNCVVRAPVTGIVLTKRAEEGSQVNPSAFSNGLSASLCDMADLSELEVDMSIPERDVSQLIKFKLDHKDKLQACTIRADAFPDQPYKGYVSRIMPTADRAKGAIPVRVRIIVPRSEAGIYLRPEMRASVIFLNSEIEDGLLQTPANLQEQGKLEKNQ